MSHVSTLELLEALDDDETQHTEALDAGPLTIEVGTYPAGTSTPKNPHNEEEVYYVISGKGKLRVGDETHTIEAGDMVYVEPALEHDFFDITEDLEVLIIFGPSLAASSYSIREDTQ